MQSVMRMYITLDINALNTQFCSSLLVYIITTMCSFLSEKRVHSPKFTLALEIRALQPHLREKGVAKMTKSLKHLEQQMN